MSLNVPQIVDEAGQAVATLEGFIDKGKQVVNHATSGEWGSVLLDVLEFFGIDVRGWVKEKLFGNFDDMSKGAGSYKEAGAKLAEISTWVREQIKTMKGEWTGQAANAAQGEMLLYSAGLDVSGEVFKVGGEGLAKVIGLLSKLADKAMELLEKFLNFIVDKIISALSSWLGWAKLIVKARGYVSEAMHFFNDAKDTIQKAIDAVKKGKEFYDEVNSKLSGVKKVIDTIKSIKDKYDEAKGQYDSAKETYDKYKGDYEHAKSYVEAALA